MFTPIGYFAAAAPTAFDPSLGGTLTVNHWWDFTDSSTMTLSGTNITSISDKQGSYNVTTAWNSGPTFVDEATGARFDNAGLSETSALPSTLAAGATAPDLTWVIISTPDVTGNLMRLVGIRSTGTYGRDDFQPMTTAGSKLWGAVINSNNGGSGAYYVVAHDWDGSDYASGYQGVTLGVEQVWSLRTYWSGTTNTFDVSLDGRAYGGAKSDTNGNTGPSDGLTFGARFHTAYQNPYYGYMKHVLVYNGQLSDANISDIYTAWTSL